MAEVAGPSTQIVQQNSPIPDENVDSPEPERKKRKVEAEMKTQAYKLEERLNGILCCTVCLDLPSIAVYQCTNGHLMCAGCFAHLLADARLKDETATCPNCRCEISKTSCTRNLAVEKAISELPAECQYCMQQLPRAGLDLHQREICQDRLVDCKYQRIGCPWLGPQHEQGAHEASCAHPSKSGDEIMGTLKEMDEKQRQEMKLYENIFGLLSFEKIAFSDLQLKPYRSDDFITKLFYETSRFSAFNLQWVVRANVNDNQKNPVMTIRRTMNYQLVLKSKIQSPLHIYFVALKGPYGEMKINPCIHNFQFTTDTQETPYVDLPIADHAECNKMLAAKNISLRLIMFQVPK